MLTRFRLVSRIRRSAGLALMAALLTTVASCSAIPFLGGSPMVSLDLRASADCNACGRPNGYPLTFRLLQVEDASALTGISLVQLWDREEGVFGPGLVAKSEDVIDPGTKRKVKIERDPKAKAVVFVGNFCQTQGTCWYFVKPLKGGGGTSLKLDLEAACLRER